MKKALFALIPALLFASCSFWNEPVEEFFSYWSSEAFITDSSVKVPNQSDKAGVPSVSSDTDSEIILKMSNPKSFRFIMPSVGNTDMIRFKGLEPQPSAGTDYKLEQLSSDTLKLTYSTQFLKKHEWGNGDLGATLTLFADDGRKFKKPYGFNLKANTPPPTPTAVLAQTAASSFSYVLCFKVPDMGVMVNGERLHKDIAQIEINGTKYPLTVESSDFRKPDDPHFILAGGVTQLTEPHSAPVPAGAWVLYYNTGVPLGAGHQAYTVKLKDDKDLVSKTLETGTTLNEPPAEIVTVTAGEQGTGSGNSDTDPFIIKGAASAPESQIKIENTAAGTTVHCTVTEVGGTAPPARYDGNPVTVPLGLDSADEKTYKVEYYTDGIGYKSNAVKTKYYKVLKQHTVTFDANGGTYTGGTTYTALVAHTMTATAPAATDNPTRTGYTFGNWYKEAACTTQWNFTSDTVTGDITLYAQWNPASGTGYKVEHYQEKTDGVGQYPASPHETDNLTGTTGANISVTSKTYPGFELDKQEPASPSIAADGSTVVKVYYKRKTVTVTFNLNGGNIGGSMANVTRTGRFGTALAPPSLVKTGYTFNSWQPVGVAPLLSSTFPASDAAYTAQWIKVYTVKFKVEGGSGGKLKGEYNGESKEASGTTQQEFANIPAGGTITFTATPNEGKGVKSWTGVTATPLDSATATLPVTGDAAVSVKFYQSEITGTVGSTRAWRSLLEAIKAAPEGATLKVSGTIQATNNGSGVTENYGEIVINKNLTIEGKNGAGTDILDANENVLGAAKAHRIFHVANGKRLTLKNLTLKNGKKAGANGGGIYSEGTLTLENTNIEGSTAANGGAISNRGTLSITGGTFSKNTATSNGGAIYSNRGTVTLNNATIGGTSAADANKAQNGGGICLDGASSTGTMNSGTISYNEAKHLTTVSQGGGIYILNSASFTMNGGTISNNKSIKNSSAVSYGGGVCIKGNGSSGNHAKFIFKGGSITSNTANYGGGVQMTEGGIFEMGGTSQIPSITGNTASPGDGGGVAVGGAMKMMGGRIADNTAGSGGGIFLWSNIAGQISLDMSGGLIQGNTATDKGNGICFFPLGAGNNKLKMKMSGTAKVDSNNDVYLHSVNTITVDDSSFTPQDGGKAATITPEIYSKATQVLSGTALGTEHGKFEVTTESSTPPKTWAVTENGKLARFVDGSKSLAWKNLKDVVSTAQDEDTIIIANTIKATDESGNSNKGEIRIEKNLTIQGNTGKASDILDADGKNRIFSVANDKTLTLKNLTLENGSGDRGGGIRADSNCTLTMTGCILKGNKVDVFGGGISARNTAITMKDCTLTGNVAHESNGTASGGVIYAYGNKMLTIENCTFTGNKGDYGGCIITDGSITLTIKNCTFTGNEGRFGGCIYAANSTVRIEGGSIGGTETGKANNATDSGGSGGGICIDNNTTLTLKNCTVTGNTAQAKGGGVYVKGYNAKLLMEGSAIITPAADKNDVYLDNNNMITVDDALTKTTPVARITVPDDKYLPSTKVLDGSKVGTEHSKFTVTPQSTPPTTWSVGTDGKLKTP